jgi:hypothetical protein
MKPGEAVWFHRNKRKALRSLRRQWKTVGWQLAVDMAVFGRAIMKLTWDPESGEILIEKVNPQDCNPRTTAAEVLDAKEKLEEFLQSCGPYFLEYFCEPWQWEAIQKAKAGEEAAPEARSEIQGNHPHPEEGN